LIVPSAITGATGWLTLVNLFFSGIASGALAFEFLVIVPAMRRQPAHLSALIHRLVLGELDLPMRVLPPASMLSGFTGLALVFAKSDPSTAYTTLYVIGFAAMATMGISTATLSHPINIAMAPRRCGCP
jgi:hypothetical protein